jgi:hypothetical protein
MAGELEILGAFRRTKKGATDYYYGGGEEAWASKTAAYAGIPAAVRPGKAFGVFESGGIIEYKWIDPAATDDGDELPVMAFIMLTGSPYDNPALAAVLAAKEDINDGVKTYGPDILLSGNNATIGEGWEFYFGGSVVAPEAQTVVLDAPDSTHVRVDIVQINAAGNYTKNSGIADGSQAIPNPDAGNIKVAEILRNTDGSNSVTPGDLAGFLKLSGGVLSGNFGTGNGNPSGERSTALNGGAAIGKNSFAIGDFSIAEGEHSYATNGAHAEGPSSVAVGAFSNAKAASSAAIFGAKSKGVGSLAIGDGSTTETANSVGMGFRILARSWATLATGRFNVGYRTDVAPGDPTYGDSLLELGNGTSEESRSNAATIFRNGDAKFQGTVDAAGFTVDGEPFETGSGVPDGGSTGQVLRKNSSDDGDASWQTLSFSKADVGLSNVDNTADTSKPVSSAQQAAIDTAKAEALAYADLVSTDVLRFAGNWDASIGYFPTTGTGTSGAIRRGDYFISTAIGTVGGSDFEVGDQITARIASPGQTSANWTALQTNTQQATTTKTGIARMATGAEAIAATSPLLMMNPATSKALIDDQRKNYVKELSFREGTPVANGPFLVRFAAGVISSITGTGVTNIKVSTMYAGVYSTPSFPLAVSGDLFIQFDYNNSNQLVGYMAIAGKDN